jgi:hypothetical protein
VAGVPTRLHRDCGAHLAGVQGTSAVSCAALNGPHVSCEMRPGIHSSPSHGLTTRGLTAHRFQDDFFFFISRAQAWTKVGLSRDGR